MQTKRSSLALGWLSGIPAVSDYKPILSFLLTGIVLRVVFRNYRGFARDRQLCSDLN